MANFEWLVLYTSKQKFKIGICLNHFKLRLPTTQLTVHAHQHAQQNQNYPLHYLLQPSYAHNKHKA